MKFLRSGALLAPLLLTLISCGIEDYIFLSPIPAGNITVEEVNSKATIRLPSIGDYYFSHFIIYYRIYISNKDVPSINDGSLSTISATLQQDYNAFLPFVNSESNNASASMSNLFTNRKYQTLALEDADIERDVLSDNAIGKTIILDFIKTADSLPPALVIDDTRYVLRRNGTGLLLPAGDPRFFNSDVLNTTVPTETTNVDVANITGTDTSGTRYTYVALYIVLAGTDPNFSPLYSAPTFVGILHLPDQS
ncbi:MAG: hypothetical protein LBD79_03030 [Treponema sp.]|jgi:hypothetical protein|nr:hypothetical protein [Treponema sp.]